MALYSVFVILSIEGEMGSYFGKLKEVAISVLPIVVVSLILGLFFGGFGEISIFRFLFSSILLIIGLTYFLLGVDNAFLPVGNQLGSLITNKKSLGLLLFSGLAIGVLVTIAEPDVRVLSNQISSINTTVSPTLFIIAIALGVGIFMALSYLRALSGFSIKIFMAIFLPLMLLISLFLPSFFVSVAFDAGGATTGPLAVPFILALGMGVSSVHGNKEEDAFGFTGIASIGPVLAVMVYSLFVGGGTMEVGVSGEEIGFIHLLGSVIKNVTSSLLPIGILSVFSVFFLFKFPRIKTLRILTGLLHSYFGIILFLFSVEYSFMPVARKLGGLIAGGNPFLLVVLGLFFGALVVLAEPAIWVLTEEVEEKSEGKVKKRLMLLFLSIGVALAVALSMVRVINDLNILSFIIPIYILILVLLPFVPPLFASIAFDSGGVATGPMSSTFLLPFVTGASFVVSKDPGSMAFGMIGLIASMPILYIEILGVIYRIKTSERRKHHE